MLKSYLRYTEEKNFGLISSTSGNVLLDESGKIALTPALSNVFIWNIRKREKVGILNGEDSEVTYTERGANDLVCVGYHDGSLRLYKLTTQMSIVKLTGHRSAVTAITFDDIASRFVTGSNDTDVIL